MELVRDGEEAAYTASMLHDPEIRNWLNAEMAAKYGFADWLVGLTTDRSKSIPIRLDPP